MANVGVVSAAYWGDVMPFVPIADELVRRGHRVTLAVPEGFHDVLNGHGFDLVHLGTDFSPRELAAHGDVMESADTIRGMRAAIDLWVRQLSIEPVDDILAVLNDVAPDLWLAHNTIVWLTELQAVPRGTPIVAGHLFPMMIPSAHQRPPMLPLPGGGTVVNRIGWAIGRAMVSRLMYDDEVNALRRRHGLPPATANVGFSWERAARVLLLASESYWPRPPDWPDHVTHTGFTVWGADETDLTSDLDQYLDAAEPPVLVTLGTSAATNARDAFVVAARAVEQAGERPLLLVGNDRNLGDLEGRDDAWVFAPLPAVLARCKAVIHAAGHGTTAAALHAGVPQIVMPQGFDQVFHGHRLEELGVGLQVPWKRRSVERLARELGALLANGYGRRAREFAALVAGEDGPATAAAEIESVLAR